MFRRFEIALALAAVLLAGCPSQTAVRATSSCLACVSSSDCTGGEVCAQLPSDSFCTAACSQDSDCASTEFCYATVTYSGAATKVCVNDTGVCSAPQGTDAGPSSSACNGLAAPSVSGTCCKCPSGVSCAANNCFSGLFCNAGNCACESPPSSCNPGAGPPSPGVVTGTVDPHNGGSVSNLYFAVVGDTRPPNEDDTAGYPTAIINKIYQDIAALTPQPEFVLGTGDYQFAKVQNNQQAPQLNLYMTARSLYKGPFWPAMGNHECDGYTADICGPGTRYGNTPNFTTFQGDFLTPIGETNPYYVRTIKATDGSWTAKFILVGLNYWSTTQQSWLQTQLNTATTYTFVVQHEGATAGDPSSLATVESMMAAAAGHVTLSIVGHSHTWAYNSGSGGAPNEVTIGNGGAPVSGGAPYGYTLFVRRPSDGAIFGTGYDYSTNIATNSFAVTATGLATQ